VLLVDADAGVVHAVEFALPPPASTAVASLRTILGAFVAGALVGAAVLAAVLARG
jgi:hypothetical protein